MSLLWYGIQGEGRGHAARSGVLIERLRALGHEVRIFTGGDAEAMFADDPHMERIPLLRFAYFKGRLSLLRSILRNTPLATQLMTRTGPVIGTLCRRARREKPALIITDFEPFLSRVGQRTGIPVVCVDHQHALSDTQLPALGRAGDDLSGRILSKGVPLIAHSPHRVVSSFAHFPLRQGSEARLVGCFLRRKVLDLLASTPHHQGDYVTVYVKEAALLDRILPVLRERPERFEIWSADTHRADTANLSFHGLHADRFLESLASCRWLLSTAGNQGLGEALAFAKPVLAIPVPGQTEQEYNALALVHSGCGSSVSLEDFHASSIASFLSAVPRHHDALEERRRSSPEMIDGTEAGLRFVLDVLEKSQGANLRLAA
jgi:uncharacterized protein (TIGR00661 family)